MVPMLMWYEEINILVEGSNNNVHHSIAHFLASRKLLHLHYYTDVTGHEQGVLGG